MGRVVSICKAGVGLDLRSFKTYVSKLKTYVLKSYVSKRTQNLRFEYFLKSDKKAIFVLFTCDKQDLLEAPKRFQETPKTVVS